jgi:hypothetical protein
LGTDPQLHPAVQPQVVQGAAFALPLVHFGNKNFEGNSVQHPLDNIFRILRIVKVKGQAGRDELANGCSEGGFGQPFPFDFGGGITV